MPIPPSRSRSSRWCAIPAAATTATPSWPAPCSPTSSWCTWSAATPPRAARRCCRSSRSTTACSGIPRTTRASRAARTSSIPAPRPTSTSCRSPTTCSAGSAAPPICVGSNYIWAWENNKIMREAVQDAGGQVIVERYLPVGETDVSAIVGQVLDCRPSFVFNTLIGDSAYAFFRADPPGRGGARHRPAQARADRQLLARRARAGRDRRRRRRRPHQLVGLFREHRRRHQRGLRRGVPGALPGQRPDQRRRRVLLHRGPAARPCAAARRQHRHGRGARRGAGHCARRAARPRAHRPQQPPLLPDAAHRHLEPRVRLRHHLCRPTGR